MTSEFLRGIEELAAERGVEDLEALYIKFMEQGPERIGNRRWTYERFRKHASHEVPALYIKFMAPLVGALEATPHERARLFLAWVEDTTEPRHVA